MSYSFSHQFYIHNKELGASPFEADAVDLTCLQLSSSTPTGVDRRAPANQQIVPQKNITRLFVIGQKTSLYSSAPRIDLH